MANFSKKVLVVEDDGMLLDILVERLSALYSVEDAIDGEIAWQKINSQPIDLILLDLLIPMVNGFELLERIRKSENPDIANIPVIVLTNLGGEQFVKRAESSGISGYFVKAQTKVEQITGLVQHVLEPNLG